MNKKINPALREELDQDFFINTKNPVTYLTRLFLSII